MRALTISLVMVAVAVSGGVAQPLVFSAARADRIDRTMQDFVDRGAIAGAVTLVLQNGEVVHKGAYGFADKAAGRRMSFDAMFRIASQTKAITSVAAMMLIEEGRLGLSDPVSSYIPGFAATRVLTRADSGRAVPARRRITIRDLLTHTAGISYGTDPHLGALYQARGLGPAAGFGWYTADKSEPICESMEALATLPFAAQPGEAFVYGYGTDVLGCVVERVSGMPLDRFFETRIFTPLGMKDTYFYVPEDKVARLAAVHRVDSTGTVVRAPDGARGQGHYVSGPRRSFAGGAGLVSTATDYARFLQMLLEGGELDGTRLLGPATVRLMTSNMVGTLFSQDGLGFSLGFQTVERAGGGGRPDTEGSFGWGGAYQTSYSVDPTLGLVVVLMTQHLPNAPAPVSNRFLSLVYQAMVPAGR